MAHRVSPNSNTIDLAKHPTFSLGGGEVDTRALEYRVGGESIKLQNQTLKVLVALQSQRGRVVTRDELIERCWGGRIVGDDVINRCISLLRPVAARSGRFGIETVPRLGYRLIEIPSVGHRRRRYWQLGGALILLAALVGLLLFVHSQRSNRRILVVMVTPFAAQPRDGADRLASDAQDSVVRMLTESGISVEVAKSRAQSANPDADLLVTGSVDAAPNGAAATISIEDVRRHAIILSRRLESDKLHTGDLPDRIGANIAAALSWNGPLILRDNLNPSDAAFLSHLLNHSSDSDYDALEGFEFARRNAPSAPNSVIAQLALAMDTGFAINAIPSSQRADAVAAGRSAADRARQLAPDFGDVYVPWCLLHSPALIGGCEDQLRTGLSRHVQASFVPQFLGLLLANAGRIDDASSFASASLAQDRYVSYKLGLTILLDEAIGNPNAATIYREATRLWPHDLSFFWLRAQGILLRGDFPALDRFEKETGERNFPPDYSSAASITAALDSRSLDALRSACPTSAQGIQAIQCMIASSELGDVDDAFLFAATLYPPRRARQPGSEESIWLQQPFVQDTSYLTIPATAALRRDPRFLALAESLGLLDYWRGGRLPDFCTKRREGVCSRLARLPALKTSRH
jgi:DNA-binding winged helix-turn-helix (wHTH) protein